MYELYLEASDDIVFGDDNKPNHFGDFRHKNPDDSEVIFSVYLDDEYDDNGACYEAGPASVGVHIDPSVYLEEDVLLSNDTRIGPNSRIGFGTVLGHKTSIGANCRIGKYVTFWGGARIEDGVAVNNLTCIVQASVHADTSIGRCCLIDYGACIYERAAIGDHCEIGHGAEIDESVQIGNRVAIYEGVYISEDSQIGDGCLIRAGGFMLPRLRLADRSIIGL